MCIFFHVERERLISFYCWTLSEDGFEKYPVPCLEREGWARSALQEPIHHIAVAESVISEQQRSLRLRKKPFPEVAGHPLSLPALPAAGLQPSRLPLSPPVRSRRLALRPFRKPLRGADRNLSPPESRSAPSCPGGGAGPGAERGRWRSEAGTGGGMGPGPVAERGRRALRSRRQPLGVSEPLVSVPGCWPRNAKHGGKACPRERVQSFQRDLESCFSSSSCLYWKIFRLDLHLRRQLCRDGKVLSLKENQTDSEMVIVVFKMLFWNVI